MAGHSKWKNIQHRKGRQDAKRGKIFTKISKEIFAAVKSAGADPQTNARLRQALLKAKEANMPSDNVDRTIKKASGDLEGVMYEEIVYEGYGPHGVALMVDILTDNRNRTAADVRHIFNKNGGNLGESGCVSFLFERRGVLVLAKDEQSLEEDELMLLALEAGAEDVTVDDEYYEVLTAPADFETVKQNLETQGIVCSSSEITMVPQTTVEVNAEQAEELLKLVDALEDNDDVQHVYANFDFE